jgi:hypothetical protein
VKHNFPFSGLITCGHCGCALVGEIKKGKYIYYHCTGHKGKCPESYARQEIFEERLGDLLKGLRMDSEIAAWVADALRKSHVDERDFREEATDRLQAEYTRLQRRLDSMYEDRLVGRIDVATFDKKATEWRASRSRETWPRSGQKRRKRRTGLPGRIRTGDPRLRRPMLYPTELRAVAGREFTAERKALACSH